MPFDSPCAKRANLFLRPVTLFKNGANGATPAQPARLRSVQWWLDVFQRLLLGLWVPLRQASMKLCRLCAPVRKTCGNTHTQKLAEVNAPFGVVAHQRHQPAEPIARLRDTQHAFVCGSMAGHDVLELATVIPLLQRLQACQPLIRIGMRRGRHTVGEHQAAGKQHAGVAINHH